MENLVTQLVPERKLFETKNDTRSLLQYKSDLRRVFEHGCFYRRLQTVESLVTKLQRAVASLKGEIEKTGRQYVILGDWFSKHPKIYL